MKLEFSRHIFETYSNIKFHKNLSSGSRVVPCGRTDRRTDMTKLVVAFRNFANAPEKILFDLHEFDIGASFTKLYRSIQISFKIGH